VVLKELRHLSVLYRQAVVVAVDAQLTEHQMGQRVPMHRLKAVLELQQEMVEALAIFGMLTILVSQATRVTPLLAVLLSMQ
jgi:hypothetical protein